LNIQRANLQDILRFYFDRRTVEDASQALEQMNSGREQLQLANLLRDHHRRSVYSKRERYLRACIDDLLLCYDILEIGALTQFIPGPDDSKFWHGIQRVLGNKFVRRYYEEYYPLRLPQLLALRLEERYRQVAGEESELANAMVQFLALDKGFTLKLNNSYLLSMLDSFTIEGYRFRNVVELISKPEVFLKRVFLPREKCSIPDLALQELSQFFQFSIDLNEFLKCLNGHPLFQSEVWNHYSYWFERIGEKLNRKLGSALDQFLGWKPIDSNEGAAVEIQEYVGRARSVIETLTSRTYCGPVEVALQGHR
jgi:hypothetical protein